MDGVLYWKDRARGGALCIVVPKVLQRQLLEELHGGSFGGHLLPKDSMQPYLGNTSGGECVQMLTDSVEDV